MAKTKKQQAVEYFIAHPDAAPTEVMRKFGVAGGNVYQYRKEAAAKVKAAGEPKTKKQQIIEYIQANPTHTPLQIAKALNVNRRVVHNLRVPTLKAMAKAQAAPVEVAVESVSAEAPVSTDQILDSRANHYGQFIGIASLTQNILGVMAQSKNGPHLAPDQAEALHMIVHKTARILNGDPDLVDSWDDIAGYAKLVADRLQGYAR